MKTTPEHDKRIAKMIFASVYALCGKSGKQGQNQRRIASNHRMVNRF